MDTQLLIPTITSFIANLEGQYKLYAIFAIVFIMTGFITRFIFKTFKWFFLLILFAIIVIGAIWILAKISGAV